MRNLLFLFFTVNFYEVFAGEPPKKSEPVPQDSPVETDEIEELKLCRRDKLTAELAKRRIDWAYNYKIISEFARGDLLTESKDDGAVEGNLRKREFIRYPVFYNAKKNVVWKPKLIPIAKEKELPEGYVWAATCESGKLAKDPGPSYVVPESEELCKKDPLTHGEARNRTTWAFAAGYMTYRRYIKLSYEVGDTPEDIREAEEPQYPVYIVKDTKNIWKPDFKTDVIPDDVVLGAYCHALPDTKGKEKK